MALYPSEPDPRKAGVEPCGVRATNRNSWVSIVGGDIS